MKFKIMMLTMLLMAAPAYAAQCFMADQLYGGLTIQGSPADPGTEMRGVVDSAVKGTYTTTVSGAYGNEFSDDKLYVMCPNRFDTINIQVKLGSIWVDSGETAVCGCGSTHNVDVNVESQPDSDNDGDGYTVSEGDCDDGNDQVYPGQTEICNEIDDNCNGETDEDFNLGTECSVGEGECAASGSLVCSQDGQSSVCDAQAGMPEDEVCDDGLDNDCDGLTDENDPDCQECQDEETQSCQKQDGVCQGSFMTCADNFWPGCDYSLYSEDYEATEQTCNDGLDNDCDASSDCDDVDCAFSQYCQPEADCSDGMDNDGDGFTDCDDTDCEQDYYCLDQTYCLHITDIRLLDADFNPVDEISDGDFYNIEVTNENTCETAVESMHIVQILDAQQTPLKIGTITATVSGYSEVIYTVGFKMEAGAGTYTAQSFNWNSWVSQPGWEALSVPQEMTFTVI